MSHHRSILAIKEIVVETILAVMESILAVMESILAVMESVLAVMESVLAVVELVVFHENGVVAGGSDIIHGLVYGGEVNGDDLLLRDVLPATCASEDE